MEPIWKQLGITLAEYNKMTWKQKVKLLRRRNGVGPIRGFFRDLMNWFNYRGRGGYPYLLEAYFREQAERANIRWNYPNAVIDNQEVYK